LLSETQEEIKDHDVNLPYIAKFDVLHSKDCIFEISAKIKEIFG